jgi:hypothetical protein
MQYLFTQGRGEWVGEIYTKEKVRGAMVHKAGSKIPSLLTVSPVYNSDKKLPQSLFTGKFFLNDNICFGVYIVN